MDAVPSLPRRVVGVVVLSLCFLLVFRTFGIEPFQVPTGSMAPAIAGRHRTVVCPRCRAEVTVGSQPPNGRQSPRRFYQRACCPNCGCDHLGLEQAPEAAGDQMLVNKAAFLFRRPRRWEVVVFRLFGKTFIKRIIGLPGDELEIVDGDIYVNGDLARKTLDEVKAQRILVFDGGALPEPDGWQQRWEVPAGQPGPHPLAGSALHLDGTGQSEAYQYVTYRNFLLDEQQCQPIRDEYGYNGAQRRVAGPVHDFMVSCAVEVEAGEGSVVLSLTDGRDTLLAEIPVGGPAAARRSLVVRAPAAVTDRGPFQPTSTPGQVFAVARCVPLQPGRAYQVEMAFVDRRLSLALDGRCPVAAVDLPGISSRPGVERPVTFGVQGARVAVRDFRLFRDVHYTQAGRNAVQGKVVHLAAGQYFVLGDNSPCSDDSRFWPEGGAVPADSLVGKPFLVHLPSRVVTWQLFGRQWQARVPDLARIHWLR
jgi:signal peptidase I